MAGRILYIAPTRGAAHRVMIVAACLAAAAAGIALSRLGSDAQPMPPTRPAAASAPRVIAVATPAVARVAPAASASATAVVVCPLQSLSLASAMPQGGTAAKTVCMGSTLVQQTGDVRSYLVGAGDADGWTLRVDMVERRLFAAALQARDGRRYACESAQCAGSATLTQANAAQTLSLRGLRLVMRSPAGSSATAATAEAGAFTLSAELRVPADDQVPGLACIGPSVSIATAGGAGRNFCGQGGAGVEIGGDGIQTYRFQDLEGRSLAVAVDAGQRVVGVELEPYSCKGAACAGASTTSAEPDNPLAERSFYFGRTALFDGGTSGNARPGLVLNGTLLLPSQQ